MNDLPVLRFHYPNSETVAYDVSICRIGQHNVSIGISIDTVDPAVLPAPPAESVDHVTLNQPFRELQVLPACEPGRATARRGVLVVVSPRADRRCGLASTRPR